MSKRFLVPMFLWVLVLIVSGSYYFTRPYKPKPDVVRLELEEASRIMTTEDGRAIASTPWTHLSDVDRFVLTNHEGEQVDSADLHGTPYVVSFFFSSCPSFCRDLNKQISQSNQAVRGQDVRFLTITVDPDVDTVPVLKKYADSFDAKADRWAFLTGSMADLKAIGENSFNVVVDRDTHTDDILLVDKWGRYRDRFKWSSAADMKRFIDVVDEVCAETKPPMDKVVQTRNVMAGIDPPEINAIPWLQDFHLPTATGKFFSRDLTGKVWVAHFSGTGVEKVGEKRELFRGSATATKLFEAAKNLNPKLELLSVRDLRITNPDSAESVSQFDDVLSRAGVKPTVVDGKDEKLPRILREYFGVEPKTAGRMVAVVDRFGSVRELIEVSDSMTAADLAAKLEAAMSLYSAEQTPVVK
jgi:protein SCO1/2